MVNIQPYKFQKKTNIDEHNDIVNKVNEIVGAINDSDLDNLPDTISAIEQTANTAKATADTATETAESASALASTAKSTADTAKATADTANSNVADVMSDVSVLQSNVNAIDGDVDTLKSTVATHTTDINRLTETTNANKVSNLKADYDSGTGDYTVGLTIGTTPVSVTTDLPFIDTVTLVPTATERAFKLHFSMKDGSVFDTNDFVIPEGGGTDVSVTGVTIEQGSSENSIKVAIQLSDGSPIESNDYTLPTSGGSYQLPELVIGGANNDALPTIGYTRDPFGSGGLYLSAGYDVYNTETGARTGRNITSASMLPTATPEGDGLMSMADKSKLDDVPDGDDIALKTEIPDVSNFATKSEIPDTSNLATKSEVSAIGISTSGNVATVNGKTANIVNNVSGSVSGSNLTINVNGVASEAITLPNGGGTSIDDKWLWENIDKTDWPSDFESGDLIRMIIDVGININHNAPEFSGVYKKVLYFVLGYDDKGIIQIDKYNSETYALTYQINRSISTWNNPQSTDWLINFKLDSVGSTLSSTATLSLTGNNKTSVITNIWRIKDAVPIIEV